MHPRVQLFQQTNTGRLIEQILLKCSRTDLFTFSEDMEFNMDHIINRTKYILDLTSITLRCITQRLDFVSEIKPRTLLKHEMVEDVVA